MVKKVLLVIGLILVALLVAVPGGLLSIFGPSDPTRTDIFLIDGIQGTYWTNERNLGLVDRTGILNQLMDLPVYDDGETMSARAGLIVSNPVGFCGYQLNSARYAWAPIDAAGNFVLPGRSTDVAPADWPRLYSPPDDDPQNRLFLDFPFDSWTGNGKEGVSHIAFALLVGYALRVNCDDPIEDKLEIFAADGADINAPPPPPPPPPPPDYVGPGTPSLSFEFIGDHEKPWAGDQVTLKYKSEGGTEVLQSYNITIDGVEVTASEQGTNLVQSYSFPIADGRTEDIAVTITAFDGQETSGLAEIIIDVGFAEETDFNFFMLLEYIVIGAVALFILFVVLWFLPIPTAFKVMIIVVAIVILLAVVLPKFV